MQRAGVGAVSLALSVWRILKRKGRMKPFPVCSLVVADAMDFGLIIDN